MWAKDSLDILVRQNKYWNLQLFELDDDIGLEKIVGCYHQIRLGATNDSKFGLE